VKRKRHPIRGLLAGFLVGLGVSIMVLVYGKLTTQDSWPVLVIIGAFMVLGLLLGLVGPTRGKKKAAAA